MAIMGAGELFGEDDIFQERDRIVSCCWSSTTGELYSINKTECLKMIRTQDKRDLIIDLTKQKAVLRSQRLKMLSRVSDTLGNMKISTPKATL